MRIAATSHPGRSSPGLLAARAADRRTRPRVHVVGDPEIWETESGHAGAPQGAQPRRGCLRLISLLRTTNQPDTLKPNRASMPGDMAIFPIPGEKMHAAWKSSAKFEEAQNFLVFGNCKGLAEVRRGGPASWNGPATSLPTALNERHHGFAWNRSLGLLTVGAPKDCAVHRSFCPRHLFPAFEKGKDRGT